MDHENSRRRVGLKLATVARRLVVKFNQRVEKMGLSRAKYSVIAVVNNKQGVTQREISDKLDVTEATAGKLVERLCADGYLERRDNPNDRRAKAVYLTPAAQPLLEKLSQIAQQIENEAFSGFTDRDVLELETILDKMADNADGKSPD